MKKLRHVFYCSLFTAYILVMSSCKTEPQPIRFGEDACSFCKMIIMDNKFGAELITEKGKVYKFDSGECMVRFMKTKRMDAERPQQLLVVDHMTGGKLIEAKTANFLHSESLSSPMGGGLTCFARRADLDSFQKAYTGQFWNWEQVVQNINP